NRHLATFAGQGQRTSEPNSAAAASDQGRLAVEGNCSHREVRNSECGIAGNESSVGSRRPERALATTLAADCQAANNARSLDFIQYGSQSSASGCDDSSRHAGE